MSGKTAGIETRRKRVEPLTYSVPEVATALGIGRDAAYELVRTGELPSLRIGRRVVVPRKAVHELVEGACGIAQGEAQ